MTNEELTMHVVRYCSLGEMPEITNPYYSKTSLCHVSMDGTYWGFGFHDEHYFLSFYSCTIKLHHPDKWREVIPKGEFKLKDSRDFALELTDDFEFRPQWVNNLLYKYNIALNASWEQYENIKFYE